MFWFPFLWWCKVIYQLWYSRIISMCCVIHIKSSPSLDSTCSTLLRCLNQERPRVWQGVFQDLEMGGVPQPLGGPSLPSLSRPLPSPSPPLLVEVGPRFAARGSGGALKLPQRVRAEPGRQTFSGAYRAENPGSGELLSWSSWSRNDAFWTMLLS